MPQTNVISTIKPDGVNPFSIRAVYALTGTCSTYGANATKVVTLTPDVDYKHDGVCIWVFFKYDNAAESPTLKINGGAETRVLRGGDAIRPETLAKGYHVFIYHGDTWELVA